MLAAAPCVALLGLAACFGGDAATTTGSMATTAALNELVWSRIDDEAVFGAASGDEMVAVTAAFGMILLVAAVRAFSKPGMTVGRL